MNTAWPESIAFGQTQEPLEKCPENAPWAQPMRTQVFWPGGSGRRKTVCRAGLYARVSTHDQQTLPLQGRAMREYAAKRGWSIVAQVSEVGFGASQRELQRERIRS